MYHLLRADEFSADEALRIGLVQEVVEPGRQRERAVELARELLQCAPLALQHTIAPYLRSAAEALATGWGNGPRARRKQLALLELALHFHTWQTLTRSGGLTNKEAAGLMAELVERSV